MTDSRLDRALRAQSRRDRAFVARHPMVAGIVCSSVGIGLAAVLRVDGPPGHIGRTLAAGAVILAFAGLAVFAVRIRLRAGETEHRIDRYLAQRSRPPIRVEDDR